MSAVGTGSGGLPVAPLPPSHAPYSSVPDAPPPSEPHYLPPVNDLEGLIDAQCPDGLEIAVQRALATDVAPQLNDYGITSAEGFLKYANTMLRWIPHEKHNGQHIYEILCMFYFILDQVPVGSLQTPIKPSSVGKKLTPLSDWIVTYAKAIGQWLDTEESITKESFRTFEDAASYNVKDAIVPDGGFKTFNEFFARKLQPGKREIANPDDPKTTVFPADSVFDGAWEINDQSVVTLKTIPWKIPDLLLNAAKPVPDNYLQAFAGGVWMHSFLNTFDYHRQHAPIGGKVVYAEVIQAAAYLDVQIQKDSDGVAHLKPIRRYDLAVNKPERYINQESLRNPGRGGLLVPGLTGDFEAMDEPGYQFLQTRGLIIIDADELGPVAVLPIGMAQVSSVVLSVKEGDVLKKGDEVSFFQFGGSDIVLVFADEAGLKVNDFPDPTKQAHFNYGQKLAIANP